MAVAVSKLHDKWQAVIGATPHRAVIIADEENILDEKVLPETIEAFANYVKDNVKQTLIFVVLHNIVKHLAYVLVKRALVSIRRKCLMILNVWLNGKKISEEISADTLLIDFVRKHGCSSVKRGCDTSNCGLCTLFVEDKPVLSCSMLAARVDGKHITTLEGLQEEAREFGAFIANQGAEQCGFCNPGFIMNAIALFRENPNPSDEEILEYLAGNLCRCSGYEGQLRGIRAFLDYKNGKTEEQA